MRRRPDACQIDKAPAHEYASNIRMCVTDEGLLRHHANLREGVEDLVAGYDPPGRFEVTA